MNTDRKRRPTGQESGRIGGMPKGKIRTHSPALKRAEMSWSRTVRASGRRAKAAPGPCTAVCMEEEIRAKIMAGPTCCSDSEAGDVHRRMGRGKLTGKKGITQSDDAARGSEEPGRRLSASKSMAHGSAARPE